ncbi:hypothetical protein C7972_113164 [Arenibacter sp. ARW7G5Y1]|nr:hypothetical protein C7972_113164 [Arenibacter sp. ARW7G5Y1]
MQIVTSGTNLPVLKIQYWSFNLSTSDTIGSRALMVSDLLR